MRKEVELQIIIKNPKEVERKLKKVGKFIGLRRQIDIYFVPPPPKFLKEIKHRI